MLRGRHRGLPVAIDRAVMLPHEFRQRTPDNEPEEGSNLSRPESLAGASFADGTGERQLDVPEMSYGIDSSSKL